MKINIVVPGLYKSGGMRAIFEISNGLVKKGHQLKIYYPIIPFNSFRGEYSWKALKNYYWDIKMYNFNKENLEYFKRGVFDIVKIPFISDFFVEDSDITIATAWQTVSSVKNLSDNKGQKIYYIQDYETWRGSMREIDKSYNEGIFSVTTCKYLHDLIFSKFKVESSFIHYGIDFELFNNPRKKYEKRRTIGFINHSADKKNTKASIQIVDAIKKKYPDVRIISFGVMNYNGLPEYINNHVNPSEQKVSELYCQSDIFLYTSKEEGFGMPPCEAMACRTAVVSTNVGALEEYSDNNESAFLHEPGDIEGMIKSVESLITDDNLLKKISENGYSKVKKMLSWEKAVNEWETLLNERLNKKI
ncbi:MAG: glycosyltransferase family 4 protein [Bacteroidota bacterium]|nr:glycosyltransferase family 4 protein [Bacteroidota bacterium]